MNKLLILTGLILILASCATKSIEMDIKLDPENCGYFYYDGYQTCNITNDIKLNENQYAKVIFDKDEKEVYLTITCIGTTKFTEKSNCQTSIDLDQLYNAYDGIYCELFGSVEGVKVIEIIIGNRKPKALR